MAGMVFFFFLFFLVFFVYRPCLLRLWSYRAGLLLQRWQHVLPHIPSCLTGPLIALPKLWQICGLDGATATTMVAVTVTSSFLCQVELRDSRLQNIVRWVENGGRICPAPGVEPRPSAWEADTVNARQRNERDAQMRAEETRRSASCCYLAGAGEGSFWKRV
jgi:hypothetical protein